MDSDSGTITQVCDIKNISNSIRDFYVVFKADLKKYWTVTVI